MLGNYIQAVCTNTNQLSIICTRAGLYRKKISAIEIEKQKPNTQIPWTFIVDHK